MRPRRAFTLIELLMVLAAVVVLIFALLLPLVGRGKRYGHGLRDGTQVRAIIMSMVMFAQGNGDSYPVPSELDKADQTLAAGEAKDLPRHMLSVLIYNGYFSPDWCVSVMEANGAIRIYDAYQYSEPSAAAGEKKLALWDPAFKATPLDADTGNNKAKEGNASYALVPPMGGRRAMYRMTRMANEAVAGNRGPGYTGGGEGEWSLMTNTPTPTTPGGVGSNTQLIHGGPKTWEGFIGYNDDHVCMETRPDPETLPFTFGGLPRGSQRRPDHLFVNENDRTRLPDAETLEGSAGENTNNFLRLWYGATVTEGKMTTIRPWYD